ncbi:MAG: hypothetical protein PVG20_00965 [Thioalkalispiraceae bacterium]|jgi:hypothetical protein
MEHVYKPPASDLENDVETYSLDYKLYKVSGIGVATFFGSILAGGLLMSRNYKHLGKELEARKALIYSFLATFFILLIAFLIPDDVHIPNLVFTIPQIIVMVQIAKSEQGQAIQDHEQRGGALASNWLAFGISILVALAIFAIIVLIAMLFL